MITQQLSLETTGNGKVDKIARYGWTMKDKPGEFMSLHKSVLAVPPEYQRDWIPAKSQDMASAWSWFGCGALVVALRSGVYYVVDGQHRLLAAMRRSDITHLPCLVFESEGLVSEAQAFLTVNSGRKPITSIGKLRALAIADDEIAKFVVEKIQAHGASITQTAVKGLEIKCMAVCQRLASQNRESFSRAFELCVLLSKEANQPILERVLSALFYIDANSDFDVDDKRFKDRALAIGMPAILAGANKAAAYFTSGGSKVWADGALAAINKGLHKPFALTN